MDKQYNMVLRRGIRNIEKGMTIYDEQLSVLRSKLHKQGVQLAKTQNLLEEQKKQTLEYANRLEEKDKMCEERACNVSTLLKELNKCRREAAEHDMQLAEKQELLEEKQNLLEEQQKQTLEYDSRLDESYKKYEVITRRFSTLFQELNKCKAELQFWRSQSPAIPAMCSSCNQEVTPVVPPGQVFVNQGVKPEHSIILRDTRQIQ